MGEYAKEREKETIINFNQTHKFVVQRKTKNNNAIKIKLNDDKFTNKNHTFNVRERAWLVQTKCVPAIFQNVVYARMWYVGNVYEYAKAIIKNLV